MECEIIRISWGKAVTRDFSSEEKVQIIFDQLIYEGCHNFAPDFIHMDEAPKDEAFFEKIATLHEKENFDIDMFNADELDFFDLEIISVGNLKAFDEELRMLDDGEIKDATDPRIIDLLEASA